MLYWLDSEGEPLFPDFAASITPTEFAPGIIHGSGEMSPIDYMVALAEGEVPAPEGFNLRSILTLGMSNAFKFHVTSISHVALKIGPSVAIPRHLTTLRF